MPELHKTTQIIFSPTEITEILARELRDKYGVDVDAGEIYDIYDSKNKLVGFGLVRTSRNDNTTRKDT